AASIVRIDLAGCNGGMERLIQFMVISSCLDFFYTKLHDQMHESYQSDPCRCAEKVSRKQVYTSRFGGLSASKTMQKTLLLDCIGILQRTLPLRRYGRNPESRDGA
ncbi:MAG TPA: hypothetical protein VEH02_10605, partial [Pseudolabrys sp.]|nr:hypothetical protein [Pseudolabrys sp.]